MKKLMTVGFPIIIAFICVYLVIIFTEKSRQSTKIDTYEHYIEETHEENTQREEIMSDVRVANEEALEVLDMLAVESTIYKFARLKSFDEYYEKYHEILTEECMDAMREKYESIQDDDEIEVEPEDGDTFVEASPEDTSEIIVERVSGSDHIIVYHIHLPYDITREVILDKHGKIASIVENGMD